MQNVHSDQILLHLVDHHSVASAFRQAGLVPDKVKKSIEKMRGGKKVENAKAEQNYEALKKYGHDLVADAEESKLDPVIGRDEEIRRVIQVCVLDRCTRCALLLYLLSFLGSKSHDFSQNRS